MKRAKVAYNKLSTVLLKIIKFICTMKRILPQYIKPQPLAISYADPR